MSSGAMMEGLPEKLRFSVNCNVFRQYDKGNGFRADLGLGMTSSSLGKSDAYRVPTTMNLLPGVEISGDEQTGITDDIPVRNATRSMAPPAESNELFAFCREPKKAQLTIFYGGKVFVVDNFPADKAEDLLQLASKSSCMVSGAQSFSLMPLSNLARGDHQSHPSPANSPVGFPPRPQPNLSDLPIARKASLHRFLEKRRDRIRAKAPYPVGSSEAIESDAELKRGVVSQPWLGLASQFSS